MLWPGQHAVLPNWRHGASFSRRNCHGACKAGKSVLVNAVGKAAEDAGAGTIGAEIGSATVLRIERSLFPLDIAATVGEVEALTFLCRCQLLLLRVDRPIGLLAD